MDLINSKPKAPESIPFQIQLKKNLVTERIQAKRKDAYEEFF